MEKIKNKTRPLKIILGILGGILLLLLLLIYVPGSNGQMHFLSNFLMNKVKTYDLSLVLGNHGVKEMILDELGDDYEETADVLYEYLADTAGEMTWEITGTDTDALTTTVHVTVIDGTDMLNAYLDKVCDEIVLKVADGDIDTSRMESLSNLLTDSENADILTKAIEETASEDKTDEAAAKDSKDTGISAKASGAKEYDVTIYFKKQYGIAIPYDASAEMYDVATAGLYSELGSITDSVPKIFIPKMVDYVFSRIRDFDIEALADLTGTSFEDAFEADTDSAFYQAIMNYFKVCASQITYDVGEFNGKDHTITVTCTHLDSTKVLSSYISLSFDYAISHWQDPSPSDEDMGTLFEQAAESQESDAIVERDVVITFDPDDYTKFTISDDIYDVLSANLYSKLAVLE